MSTADFITYAVREKNKKTLTVYAPVVSSRRWRLCPMICRPYPDSFFGKFGPAGNRRPNLHEVTVHGVEMNNVPQGLAR